MSRPDEKWLTDTLARGNVRLAGKAAKTPRSRVAVDTKPPKAGKFGNQKCEYAGTKFDSKREMDRYIVLKLMLAAGEIRELELQVEFELMRTPVKEVYRSDFTYYERRQRAPGCYYWQFVVDDAKGHRTRSYVHKRRLMKIVFGIVIRET